MDRKEFLTGLWREQSHQTNVANPSENDEISQSSYQPSASTSMATYVPRESKPWDRRRVLHLIRRTNMGATHENVSKFLEMGPSQAVDIIVDQAVQAKKIPKPSWLVLYPPGDNATRQETEEYSAKLPVWDMEITNDTTVYSLKEGLQSKLFIFWHSHFSTQRSQYNWPQSAYLYVRLIQDYLFGDFKSFTRAMGLNPAMLVFLNNDLNQKGSPNTNYARELLELYTLGEGNGYNEKDIDEIARSITGYSTDNWDVKFFKDRYDDGEKTIFGQAGHHDYEGVINLLFEKKASLIARHVVRKLYKHFIYANPAESVVNELANVFLKANFVIEPVLRTMLKSEHFFEDELIGCGVSSPTEHICFIKNTLGIPDDIRNEGRQGIGIWYWNLSGISQNILEPPSVAGWPGHRTWLNTALLPNRWDTVSHLLWSSRYEIWEYARKMSQPNNPYALARELAEYLLPVSLNEDEYKELGDVLLGGIPAYEWNIYDHGSIHRILNLLQHLNKIPEFQLN